SDLNVFSAKPAIPRSRLAGIFLLGSDVTIRSVGVYDVAGRCVLSINNDISDAVLARINNLPRRSYTIRIIDNKNKGFSGRFMGRL
ncbi:MAG: hypothetical protein PHC61_17090, partial [Chitinivibrionales bacterium]|nr:hypothetical protein [Chitinivibrionales bacterium]